MERKMNEMWKVKEGSKTIWKVQCPKGILSFTRKRDAIKWVDATSRANNMLDKKYIIEDGKMYLR